MKKTLFICLIIASLFVRLHAKESEYSYIRVNPKLKLGKVENGNHFLDVVFGKFNWRINNQFAVAGGASVGFTAPRSSFAKMNHYMNRLTVKASYRPFGGLSYFVEANFSNLIDGSNNPVGYFRTGFPEQSGNYQAIGIEFDWFEFTKS